MHCGWYCALCSLLLCALPRPAGFLSRRSSLEPQVEYTWICLASFSQSYDGQSRDLELPVSPKYLGPDARPVCVCASHTLLCRAMENPQKSLGLCTICCYILPFSATLPIWRTLPLGVDPSLLACSISGFHRTGRNGQKSNTRNHLLADLRLVTLSVAHSVPDRALDHLIHSGVWIRYQPLMEDLEIISRLRKIGKVVLLPPYVTTSARRHEKIGLIRSVLFMWYLRTLYKFGTSPTILHRMYIDVR